MPVNRVEQVVGALVFLLGLLNVFLTVIYARAGTGIVSRGVTLACWRVMLLISRFGGPSRGKLLSFCGPLNLSLLVVTWSALLALGAGLILHPELGKTVRPSSGAAETDFVTALYVGGSSLSLVGSSSYEPKTAPLRLLFLFNSIAGTSVLSLTLTYLMQVYSALRARTALGLAIDYLTLETGDAARLLSSIAPDGDISMATSDLGGLASEMVEVKEAHHFYPVLFYFRFEDPRYSVSRFVLVALDAVSLLRSALDGPEANRLKRSGAVEQLNRASLMLVHTLEKTFLLGAPSDRTGEANRTAEWRRRYSRAISYLADAGLPTTADRASGEAAYIRLRAQWDSDIAKLAPALGYDLATVDTAEAGFSAAPSADEASR